MEQGSSRAHSVTLCCIWEDIGLQLWACFVWRISRAIDLICQMCHPTAVSGGLQGDGSNPMTKAQA